MKIILESQIEKALVARVKKHGGCAMKFVSPGMTGVPDRLVLLPGGRIWFVELKAPGRKLSPKQVKIASRLESLGHKVWVIDNQEKIAVFLQEVLSQ